MQDVGQSATNWESMRCRVPPARPVSDEDVLFKTLTEERNEIFHRLTRVDDFIEHCLRVERARATDASSADYLAELEVHFLQVLAAWRHITRADNLLFRRRNTPQELAELREKLAACSSCICAATPKTFRPVEMPTVVVGLEASTTVSVPAVG